MQVKLSKHLSSFQNIHSAKNTESDNLIRNRCRFHIVRPVHSGEEPLFLIYEHSHIQLLCVFLGSPRLLEQLGSSPGLERLAF